MSKITELASCFDVWMKKYNHHGATDSQSFRDFITCDREIEQSGTSYEEYVALAFALNKMGYSIEWVVSANKYEDLLMQSQNRRFEPRDIND